MRRRRLLKSAALLAASSQLVTSVGAQSSDSIWPMFQYDATNTGYNADSSIPSEQIGEQWSGSTLGEVVTSPIIADGKTFVGSRGGNVHAFDSETGKKLWQFSTETSIESTPAVHNGNLFVGDSQATVYSISMDGTENWSTSLDSAEGYGVFNPITAYDGELFVPVSNPDWYSSYLVSVSASDGSITWRHPSDENTDGRSYSTPVVDGETVYVSMGGIRAVDVFDGEANWVKDSASAGNSVYRITGEITLSGNELIIGSDNLICLATTDGSLKWTYNDSYLEEISSIAIDGRDVYFTANTDSDDGYVYSIDKVTRERNWRQQLRSTAESDPVITPGKVLAGADDGKLYAFERDEGDRLWTFSTSESVKSTPSIVQNSVYFGSNDGYAYKVGKAEDTPTETRTETASPTDTPEEQSTATDTATSEPTETPTDTPLGTSTATETEFERGFFINNGGTEMRFISNPFLLTVGGFLLSVLGIIYQLVEGE